MRVCVFVCRYLSILVDVSLSSLGRGYLDLSLTLHFNKTCQQKDFYLIRLFLNARRYTYQELPIAELPMQTLEIIMDAQLKTRGKVR